MYSSRMGGTDSMFGLPPWIVVFSPSLLKCSVAGDESRADAGLPGGMPGVGDHLERRGRRQTACRSNALTAGHTMS